MSDPIRVPMPASEPFAVDLPPSLRRLAPPSLPLTLRNRLRAAAVNRCRPA